jgi:hypothetical protein
MASNVASTLFSGLFHNTAINSESNTKVDFINKYGSYADNYDKLNNLGEQTRIWPYIISILLLIGLIACFMYSKQEENKETGEKIPRTKFKEAIYYLGYVFLVIFIISIIYNGVYYFAFYLPQYRKWYNSLPQDAINLLNTIKTLETVTNISRNYYNAQTRAMRA